MPSPITDFMVSADMSSSRSTHSSSTQLGNQIGYRFRNMATQNKPQIEIVLDDTHGAHGSYVTSYSTMDSLEGFVRIQPVVDTRFDDIEISFVGKFRRALSSDLEAMVVADLIHLQASPRLLSTD